MIDYGDDFLIADLPLPKAIYTRVVKACEADDLHNVGDLRRLEGLAIERIPNLGRRGREALEALIGATDGQIAVRQRMAEENANAVPGRKTSRHSAERLEARDRAEYERLKIKFEGK